MIETRRRRLFNYRSGREVLEGSGLLNEVLRIADGITASQLSRPDRHKRITQAFENEGWRVEEPVKGFRIDCFRDGAGLEVELSHIVHVYHDLFKFMIPFSQGRLDAGILLILGDSVPERGLVKNHSSLPTASNVKMALRRLKQYVPVPLLLIAIE